MPLLRILTDRGARSSQGNPERHEYEPYLAVEGIEHTQIKTRSPQTNGFCERFHLPTPSEARQGGRTMLDEFCRTAFVKKIYRRWEELQADVDSWVREYNEERPHQGRWCYGKTPMETFPASIPVAREKVISA